MIFDHLLEAFIKLHLWVTIFAPYPTTPTIFIFFL